MIQPTPPNTHSLVSITPSTNPTFSPPLNTHPTITTLLTKYQHIFSILSGLPPQRLIDHTIPLLPNTTPINVHPYRYPHSQKAEIVKQVQDLLNSRAIRNSSSLFSSSVILVKKKRQHLASLHWLLSLKCSYHKVPLPNSSGKWVARWVTWCGHLL